MRLTEKLVMLGIDLVDLHSAFAPCRPSQLEIVDVVVRLLGTLEQHHRGPEPLRRECLRPVRFGPRLRGLDFSSPDSDPIAHGALQPIHLFAWAYHSHPA